ncbi:TonB-dependent receptor [Qipengyuania nanhaisediminis]|uniref:TonB-dependent Receptor Plug Domain n=1 Tax=Qipengyuania nanhaisediminis TaxID=604088 RepID=A0A1I5KCJ0_9SPHN|nr:TonB-dependent receptor [Qipengyuania nanhaisediminis]SFO82755.1 TonB-dependent Receptor Plug Domain [Qipengyuania nanhaisediminis]
MKFKYLLAASAVSLTAGAAMVAAPAAAQQITSAIQGTVQDENGAPLAGAEVIVTDTRTGASRTVTTGPAGGFAASNLTVGGPYTVAVAAPGFEGQTLNDVNTSLQGATDLTFTLTSGSGVIVVTGARVATTQIATGPGQSFGLEVLESAPTFDRDIRDIIRIDPRVSLDRDDSGSGVDRISCLGGNDRSNAFTIDGINQGDVYGLNDTGFASRSSAPIPYDAIRETQVAFAPFDVDYGNFTGCAINAVTKSGSNEYHFGGFFEYSDQDLRGDQADGVVAGNIEPLKRWGGYVSGPIIKDRLFVFAAYEHQEAGFPQEYGPAGGGFGDEIGAVSVEQFNEISDVLSSVYGIETGPIVYVRPYENDRYFVRADLQITDDHRFEATYQNLQESTLGPDDFSQFGSFRGSVVGANTFNESGTESEYYSGRLYSQWSDAFSTELRYSRSEIQDLQGPLGGGEAQDANPIPRIVVGIDNGAAAGADQYGAVQAGPGFSRSANDLQTKIDQFRAAATLEAGVHRFKAGVEWNHANLFNLFVQNATGQLVFQNIDDLREGILSNGDSTFTNPENVATGEAVGAYGAFSATGDVRDAAAAFSRDIYSAFLQDEWMVSDRLDVTLGLRVDWYDGDAPALNPNFVDRYGFGNNTGFSALDPIVMPRASFAYDLGDFATFSRAELRGGVGIFSGGDPLVWFGNAFQGDGRGFAQGDTTDDLCPAGPIDVVQNGSFTGVPQCFRDAAIASAAAGLGDTQSIDPDIEVPSVVRANLGFSSALDFAPSGFFSNWSLNLDYIYSRYRNPYTIVDLSQIPDIDEGLNGFAIDGRPIYAAIEPTRSGCDAVLVDTYPPTYTGVTGDCFGTRRDNELMLTNSAGYDSQIVSAILAKRFNGGLFTDGGSVNFSLGYAFTDANDRRNMYNSTAGSNYDRTAAFDRQAPAESRGFFASKHNITARTSFREEFFDDLTTRLGVTFVARSGRPYSITFSGSGDFNDSTSGNDNVLAYIPSGISDPNVSPLSDADAVAEFNEWALSQDCVADYVGSSIARNTCENEWYYDMDVSFSQEIPGPGRLFGRDDRLTLFASMDNFLNFLDSDWNIQRRRNFSGLQDVAGTDGVDDQGRYIITSFRGADAIADDAFVNVSSSLWRLKIGVSYDF